MTEQVTKLRVFVASPGDVQKERELLSNVIEELNRGIAAEKGLVLELVRWETHAWPDIGEDAQDVINRQIGPGDVFVGIMWNRFGTPTKRAESGTEEEFDRAYASWKQYGRPKIMFYFNRASFSPSSEDELEQKRKVLAFKKELGDKGALYWEYNGADEFERAVRGHLAQVIRQWGPEGKVSSHPKSVSLKPPPRIPWLKVKELCAEVSTRRLKFVAQRFDTALYVHRQAVQEHVDRFLKAEDKNYFALVGKSGMGKTAFLWGLADKMQERQEVACLFCDASIHLKGKQSVIDALLGGLAQKLGIPPEDTLRAIQPSDEQLECRLVFMVDAINEFQSMNDMKNMLRDFNDQMAHYPWIRLILSCRPHFWIYIGSQQGAIGIAERYFYRADDSEELFVRLGQLNDEEMAELYGKYRSKYRFDPADLTDLDLKLQKRLREPLMLRLISEVCAGKSISEMTYLVLVDIEAIPEYVKKLREKGDLSKQGEDERFLERTLPKLFVQNDICTNYVPRDRVIECCGRKDVEQILGRLLRSGILKEDGVQRLSFGFERFYGYYFGLYLREVANKGKAVDCNTVE